MTTCDGMTGSPCRCESCGVGELPVNPFLALRVAYGMLLGEDEFRTMMGNPRGKQMLHAAWLHRCGVVWGFDVQVDGVWTLQVSPGLGVDGLGREVACDVTSSLNVQKWLDQRPAEDFPADSRRRPSLWACLVAEFDCCPTSPVPTLANPCDVTRKHDDFSRVVETARLELRPSRCASPPQPYHRLRVLLGLDDVGKDDEAGSEALAARRLVAEAQPHQRPRELLHQFRALAAADVAAIRPATEPPGPDGHPPDPTRFPLDEQGAAVVLADIEIVVLQTDNRTEIYKIIVHPAVRTALLPTSTIQELTCALAPGLLGSVLDEDTGAPRVIADSLDWSEDGRVWSFAVTAPLVPGSIRRAIRMTSLSTRGWVDEDIDTVRYDPTPPRVVIEMADRPINPLVRIVVRGTGSTPIFGAKPALPLAGLAGDPPVRPQEGQDAVLTLHNPLTDRREQP